MMKVLSFVAHSGVQASPRQHGAPALEGIMGLLQQAAHTSLNVAQVSLKCQIHSSSVSFSFTILDELASTALVEHFIFMHLSANWCKVWLSGFRSVLEKKCNLFSF